MVDRPRLSDPARIRRALPLAGVLLIGAIVFLLGINWGLPSRAVDPYLFGTEKPWSGERIYLAAGGFSGQGLGADVDRNPLVGANEAILLNSSDRQKAEIIRRYRLYSYQPDEMITFRALAQMRPSRGEFDPTLYQYGGLWIYPVGALLKAAMWVRFIPTPPPGIDPLVYYLDHPAAFGRFYIVARLYSALWGLVGVWAVFHLARRMCGDVLLACAAATAFVFLPVVLNGAHEAKPHLAGLSLMLLAILAGAEYLQTRRTRWWILCGALCGAALGMVLSSLAVFLVPVVMAMRTRRVSVGLAAIAVGVAVYVVTNPYVPINFLRHSSEGGQALRSNLSNSKAMYHPSPRGVKDAVVLLGLGASPLLALLGVGGAGVAVATIRRRQTVDEPGQSHDAAWLLFVPAGAVLAQFILLAAGKPAEYARFGMLPDVALLLLAAWGASLFSGKQAVYRQALAALLVAAVLPYGLAYSRAFLRDSCERTSRIEAAEELLQVTGRILLRADPAPYNCPPVNLFRYRQDLVLVPRGVNVPAARGDVLLWPVDTPVPNTPDGPRRLPFKDSLRSLDQFTTPITWANKTFAAESTGANVIAR